MDVASFIAGFATCLVMFFAIIYWEEITRFTKKLFSKNTLFKLDLMWWNTKHYFKYKVFKND